MTDFSLDDVLNLEDGYYEKGFHEGHEHSAKEQFMEGKVYGLQTGFQRFLIVGYLHGLLEEWSQEKSPALAVHLKQLSTYLAAISMSNDDQAVVQYEKSVTSARNKARVIAAITKTGEKLSALDALIKSVGGNLLVSEDLNEMW
ncbi:DUF1715-domain-containing protein [Metschnikowia bicuspidata var. bicuspidata NRRL YB-4993]|uniref:DUF1715-domain-containing protein n=1 Tax=Metschnikowia bicuspidata var. bicuspidata NRRL YB-4993 TaxID=869754 RepID=A0A1A0H7Y8_9ASCO|nr:DUF1715-domain-containing protein [Metschnikowia bicuspidata var. bicuspidata NRRL YB-4993]OBA20214.1 DUF1715-domain-containing protein [Metschnikowia bicuspidata var. bicuspidata NRRL YB-4993]